MYRRSTWISELVLNPTVGLTQEKESMVPESRTLKMKEFHRVIKRYGW